MVKGFMVFETYCSEPPFQGHEVSMVLAALMTPALPEPVRVKGVSFKRQRKASREASKEEGLEVEASGDTDIVDPIDEEDDEAATSMHGGYESDDGDDDDNDDSGDDNGDDDGDDDVNDNDKEPHQAAEDEEVDEEELGRSLMETPCQPLKKLRRGLREDTPISRGGRELRGKPCKSLSLEIPVVMPVAS